MIFSDWQPRAGNHGQWSGSCIFKVLPAPKSHGWWAVKKKLRNVGINFPRWNFYSPHRILMCRRDAYKINARRVTLTSTLSLSKILFRRYTCENLVRIHDPKQKGKPYSQRIFRTNAWRYGNGELRGDEGWIAELRVIGLTPLFLQINAYPMQVFLGDWPGFYHLIGRN